MYRVENIILVKRLLPLLNNPATLLIEEQMLDSMSPVYHNEVQLLLTAFDPIFSNESEAVQAIHLQNLTERVEGLLRLARGFSERDCRVVHQTSMP
ncbi:MAG: hypothetical protein H8K07_05590 [Nitrospira sp.]|nr:hypothetical protein [Nitrospira sp.]